MLWPASDYVSIREKQSHWHICGVVKYVNDLWLTAPGLVPLLQSCALQNHTWFMSSTCDSHLFYLATSSIVDPIVDVNFTTLFIDLSINRNLLKIKWENEWMNQREKSPKNALNRNGLNKSVITVGLCRHPKPPLPRWCYSFCLCAQCHYTTHWTLLSPWCVLISTSQ